MSWLSQKLYYWRRKIFGGFDLDDPRPIAKASPYTYYLPPIDHVAAVASGDLVKLIFRTTIGKHVYEAERMWVEVTNRSGENFEGLLKNEPFDMPHLQFDDPVTFKAFNVIDIDWDNAALESRGLQRGPEQQIWDRCMVDDAILDGSVKVEYIYREAPDMTQENDKYPDSGWRIRGDVRSMTDEQYENGTASYVALGVVLNKDDSWIHLMDEPVGTAYLRNWDTGLFEATEFTTEPEP